MTLGWDRRLYVLAFDHRTPIERMFGIEGRAPSTGEAARIRDAKALVYAGFERALERGVPREAAGVLVDAQYAAALARRARAAGIVFAMPVERSGTEELELEGGEGFGERIEEFAPTFSKVLVRYAPDGDAERNARQRERLLRLSDWLHERGRRLMLELIVPAPPVADPRRFEDEARPGLVLRALEQLQDAGIEPDVWKLEGIASPDDCARVAALARRDGRDRVGCVVLGQAAPDERVDVWLRAAAATPGWIGFAVGRSIFGEAVRAHAAGSTDREAGIESVARLYGRFVEAYEAVAPLAAAR